MNEQLTQTQGNIGQQLQGATEVISKVQLRLGELFETAKHMQELGKDISRLQDILRAPKLRGGIGEYLLEDLLSQILPQRNYETQYAFKSGEKVDVLIRLGSNTVPVDAKFPLESFERLRQAETEAERKKAKREFMTSVKARIDEIARKYIRPDEGTYDFALMYIPAENVFYEVIVKDEELGEEKSIASYALERHVVPVSPNSFYAYLMAIAFGLRGFHIEKQAQEIRGSIGELQKLFGIFYEQFTAVGRNIDLAHRKYEEAHKRAEKIHDQMAGITGQALHLEGERTLPSSVDKKED
jgi:DNA recombination protein RmuC